MGAPSLAGLAHTDDRCLRGTGCRSRKLAGLCDCCTAGHAPALARVGSELEAHVCGGRLVVVMGRADLQEPRLGVLADLRHSRRTDAAVSRLPAVVITGLSWSHVRRWTPNVDHGWSHLDAATFLRSDAQSALRHLHRRLAPCVLTGKGFHFGEELPQREICRPVESLLADFTSSPILCGIQKALMLLTAASHKYTCCRRGGAHQPKIPS